MCRSPTSYILNSRGWADHQLIIIIKSAWPTEFDLWSNNETLYSSHHVWYQEALVVVVTFKNCCFCKRQNRQFIRSCCWYGDVISANCSCLCTFDLLTTVSTTYGTFDFILTPNSSSALVQRVWEVMGSTSSCSWDETFGKVISYRLVLNCFGAPDNGGGCV